ncbi:O-antigen ligase family protein [Streptomyces sp. TRM72054]|uniref:O-antigen ligase family protein n=1 Tax=Streptomyces sp. TRM72054 TaxID=2870562 RepID=UPI0027E029D0|nr:O-antigen ligase family protein [Streptomyces sp. TRM72054]
MGSTGVTSAAGAEADGGRRSASDAAGVIVLGACALWSLITAAAHGGRPEGVLLAVLAVAAGYAAGRICGALAPVAAPLTGALAGIALTIGVPHLAPGPQPGVPLGHVGATAALLALSTGAACCAAWSTAVPALRPALWTLAAGIVATAAVLGTTTGVVASAAVLLCSLAARRMGHRGIGLAALAAVTAVVTGLTWAVASSALPEGLAASLEGPLTGHRVELWRDALALARQDPALGVGPGRFGELSATSVASPLSDGKPHSALLQQAAEQGAIGVMLLAAAFCWVLYALWRTARPTPVALSAGAAVTALAAVAAVGNALSFTAVSVGAGLLAGLATARPLAGEPTRQESVVPGDRQVP